MNFDEINFPYLPVKTEHELFLSCLTNVFFQLQRKREKSHLNNFGDLFSNLLTYFPNYSDIIFKLIFYTRDIHNGKGECQLTYEMIYRVYLYDPLQIPVLLNYLVNYTENDTIQPYIGSWKDIKRLSIFIFEKTDNICHPIIDYCVQLFNQQLDKDYKYINNIVSNEVSELKISNVAKWIPRENKVEWLFNLLAMDWCKKHTPYLLHKNSLNLKSINKSRMNYRKIISRLNQKIKTTEIYLCKKNIDEIDPHHVPISTFIKNKDLFLDLYSYGNLKKEILTENFKKYIDNPYNHEIKFRSESNIHMNSNDPHNVDLGKMVNNAWKLLEEKNKISSLIVEGDMNLYLVDYLNVEHKIGVLNKLWANFLEKCAPIETTIPCIDVSLSMHEYNKAALFEAIGIACAIANKSVISDRILALDNEPIWIHLPNKESSIEYGFVSQIKTIFESIKGKTISNLKDGMQLIADSIQTTKTSYRNVDRLAIVLISNFQSYSLLEEQNIHNYILSSFYLGSNIVPYFIYWNLSSDIVNLPADEKTKRVCFYSGSTLSNIHYLNTLYSKSDRELDSGEFILDLLNKKYPIIPL